MVGKALVSVDVLAACQCRHVWRCQVVVQTPTMAALARSEHIYKDQRFSDHAPMTVDYDFTL